MSCSAKCAIHSEPRSEWQVTAKFHHEMSSPWPYQRNQTNWKFDLDVYAPECMHYQNIVSVCKHHWLIHRDLTGLDMFEFRRQNHCQFCNGSWLMNGFQFQYLSHRSSFTYSGKKKVLVKYLYCTYWQQRSAVHYSWAVQRAWKQI